MSCQSLKISAETFSQSTIFQLQMFLANLSHKLKLCLLGSKIVRMNATVAEMFCNLLSFTFAFCDLSC